jgi:hypothetical protein
MGNRSEIVVVVGLVQEADHSHATNRRSLVALPVAGGLPRITGSDESRAASGPSVRSRRQRPDWGIVLGGERSDEQVGEAACPALPARWITRHRQVGAVGW